MVDSFSKWVEIEWMKKGTDCSQVLLKLVEMFSRFGLPDILVSDGGPPFNSFSFKQFLEKQGIIVLKSPPYHPSSNDQAERLVRTVKEVLKKFLLEPGSSEMKLEDQINLFLFNYRNTASNDGSFPSEKILTYLPKTLIDLINPKKGYKCYLSTPQINDECSTMDKCVQLKQTDHLNELTEGDEVWYRNCNQNEYARWVKAIYLKRLSIKSFQIMIGSARIMAHRAQLKICKRSPPPMRSNILISVPETEELPMVESREEEEIGELPERPSNRRWKRNAQAANLPDERLRRSKRVRTQKKDMEFVYT